MATFGSEKKLVRLGLLRLTHVASYSGIYATCWIGNLYGRLIVRAGYSRRMGFRIVEEEVGSLGNPSITFFREGQSPPNPGSEKVVDEYAVIQAEPHRSLCTVRPIETARSSSRTCKGGALSAAFALREVQACDKNQPLKRQSGTSGVISDPAPNLESEKVGDGYAVTRALTVP
jgi:hypothetical protein